MGTKAFWMMSSNAGDALTPWLVKRITGEPVLYTNKDHGERYYVVSGSILNHAEDNAVVWGAGLGSMSDSVNPQATLLAVRGPLSRFRAEMCGNSVGDTVLGDPGLLCPKVYQPASQNPAYEVGIIPHYVDQVRVDYHYGDKPEFKVINILDPLEAVIDLIISCKFIVSSSLHGLILADAYGVPNAWAKFDERLGGDGFKFLDYLLTVGRASMNKPPRVNDVREGVYRTADWWRKRCELGTVDVKELWEKCPFQKK